MLRKRILLSLLGTLSLSYAMDCTQPEERTFDTTKFPIQTNEQLSKILPQKDHLIVGGCTSRGVQKIFLKLDPTYSYPISTSSQLWDKTGPNCLTCNIQHQSGADFYADAYNPSEIFDRFPVLNNQHFKKINIEYVDHEPIRYIAKASLRKLGNFDLNSYNNQNLYRSTEYLKNNASSISNAIGTSFSNWMQMLKDEGQFEYKSFAVNFCSPERELKNDVFFFTIKGFSDIEKLKQTKYKDEQKAYPIHGQDGSSMQLLLLRCFDLLDEGSPYKSDISLNIYKNALEQAGLKDISIEFVYRMSVTNPGNHLREFLKFDMERVFYNPNLLKNATFFLRFKGTKKPSASCLV